MGAGYTTLVAVLHDLLLTNVTTQLVIEILETVMLRPLLKTEMTQEDHVVHIVR